MSPTATVWCWGSKQVLGNSMGGELSKPLPDLLWTFMLGRLFPWFWYVLFYLINYRLDMTICWVLWVPPANHPNWGKSWGSPTLHPELHTMANQYSQHLWLQWWAQGLASNPSQPVKPGKTFTGLLQVDLGWDCDTVPGGCLLVTTTGITWSFQEHHVELEDRAGRDGKELRQGNTELLGQAPSKPVLPFSYMNKFCYAYLNWFYYFQLKESQLMQPSTMLRGWQ